MLPISGLYILVITVAVFAANPRRTAYRLFFVFGLSLAAWYWVIQRGGLETAAEIAGLPGNPIPWLRANAMISAMFPWLIYLVNEALTPEPLRVRDMVRRSLPWLLPIGLGIPLSLSENYAYGRPVARGYTYFIVAGLGVTAHACLAAHSIRHIQNVRGGLRLETQFLALIPTLSFLLAILAFAAGKLLDANFIRRIGLLVPIAGMSLVAYLILSPRVRDARNMAAFLAPRAAITILVGLGLVKTWAVLGQSPAFTVELLTVCGALISIGFWLDHRYRHWREMEGKRVQEDLRARALDIARSEPRPEFVAASFEKLLQTTFDTCNATLVYEGDPRGASRSEFSREHPAYRLVAEQGWATPESIGRRRHTNNRELLDLFERQNIGVIIVRPRNSPAPSLVVVLGPKRDGWPFTFPEIDSIQHAAELMDNILTNSRLTAQAALKAQVEHLAMMSRGLAHDLKNLITPVSSFLVHAEPKIAPDTVEHEVHAAAKRSVRIMNDYIREALFFANRLEPRFEGTRTGKIFDAVLELTAARTSWRQVKVVVALESDHALVADAVLLQRMLGNLVANAIDASSPDKSVTLSATLNNARGLRLSVVDQGNGIAPEHLSRIYEPYFTTKEFGDDVRGFGLGLTISQKIVHLHHGAINVQSQLGVGTAVLVDLPLTQPAPAGRMTEHSIAEAAAHPHSRRH